MTHSIEFMAQSLNNQFNELLTLSSSTTWAAHLKFIEHFERNVIVKSKYPVMKDIIKQAKWYA